MKSKLFFVVALITVLFISAPAPCQDEQITLSTYYPAPYGEYDELCAEKLLVDTPSAQELQDMARGDCHITRSLIVGTAGGGFSYDALNFAGTPLYDGDVIIEGLVGIGTTSPTRKLDVNGDAIFSENILVRPQGTAEGGEIFLQTLNGGSWSIIGNDSLTYQKYPVSGGSEIKMILTNTGNVGIGTASPGNRLSVSGNVDTDTSGIELIDTVTPGRTWWITSGVKGVDATTFGIKDQTGGSYPFVIKSSGNVGIGTTAPEYGTLDIVSPYSKTDTTLRNVLRLRTNDAANPFDLKVTVTGAAALKDRTFRLQTGDHLLSNDGNLAIQPYGGSVSIFGSWTDNDSNGNPLVRDAVYRATTDGFVIARWEGISEVAITGLTDGNNPPTSRRAQNVKYSAAYQGISFTMPVRKGDYWKVYNAAWMHWLPIGNGLCERQ